MPYRRNTSEHFLLWPHRSLSPGGFVGFIAITAALIALPLLPQLGTAGLWLLLPFMVAAVAGVWIALRQSFRTDSEELSLSATEIRLIRHRPGKPDLVWSSNPHWVTPALHPAGGPVPDYLTLSARGQRVELGAFLTPAERRALLEELESRLARLRQAQD